MKKREIFLAVLAVSLILGGAVGSAWAYFTTYVEAWGGYTVSLGDETHVEEEFSSWMKRVVVVLEEGSEPVYVRARAFGGEAYPLTYWYEKEGGAYPLPSEDSKWIQKEDGYFYYKDYLYDDKEKQEARRTSPLLVKIENVPAEVKEPEFDVVVVYETTPVQYKEDGTPYRADEINWDDAKLSVDRMEGGAGR